MKRKQAWGRFGVVLFALCVSASALAAERRPNIVIILADDQGWGDLSLNGNTNLATPRIDSLARDGAMFDRFFVCPVCSPTRAEFLTGRYHPRGGVYSTSTGGERLDLDETTIGDVFHAAGYATGAFGKWHNGTQYPYHPNARGFDEYTGFCSGHWGNYFNPILEHNGHLIRPDGYISDILTDAALRFIDTNKDRPFFCYLPFNTPHSPMQVPDRFYKKFDGAVLEKRHRDPDAEDVPKTRAALAMCENVDWNVGRVLDRLDKLNLADNTIVIYFSDNGPNGKRFNGDMKGQKGSTDEGGVRVPFVIRWPGHIKPGTTVTKIAGAIDLLPTLADLADVPLGDLPPLDGVSIRPLLEGTDAENPAAQWPDRMIFSHWAGKVSVRTQQYRLGNAGKLFDMTSDPGQRYDVASEHPDVARRLSEAVADWKAELLPGLTDDDRPFPVGYREFPITYLPARDGVPHGNVKRSAGAPNCSFFTGWSETTDRMTWDVEVATAGRFDAIIYYTCRPADVGATVRLSLADAAIDARVTEAHDPPLYGMENDRVPRHGESYVKDFAALRLGTVELPAGRGELTLQATDIPGDGVIDVRCIQLTLLDGAK